MREVLDRLREAGTALDGRLTETYYMKHTADRLRAIELLWKAKKNLWWAHMHALDAFAGTGTPVPKASELVSYESAAAAYEEGLKKDT